MCNLKVSLPNSPEFEKPNITDDQALAVFVATDDGLCQLVASNSGPAGDKALVSACVAELESRAQLRETLAKCEALQAKIDAVDGFVSKAQSRRSFLAGLFGLVGVGILPKQVNDSNGHLHATRYTHPTIAHWQAQFDQAIAALTAIRDGIGGPITGQRFYELETDIFNTLGDLVEAMESEPFNELVIALGIKNDYLRALGVQS